MMGYACSERLLKGGFLYCRMRWRKCVAHMCLTIKQSGAAAAVFVTSVGYVFGANAAVRRLSRRMFCFYGRLLAFDSSLDPCYDPFSSCGAGGGGGGAT